MMYAIAAPWVIIGMIYGAIVFNDSVLPRIKNRIDIWTKGKTNQLADTYVCILAHVIEKPEEWKIDKDSLSFPKEGRAVKISIIREKDKIQISQDSIQNGDYIDVKGYFYNKFVEIMDRGYKNKSMLSMMNALYPDSVIMIEDQSSDAALNPLGDMTKIQQKVSDKKAFINGIS